MVWRPSLLESMELAMDGEVLMAKLLIYVMEEVNNLYLSRQCSVQLGIPKLDLLDWRMQGW